MDVVAASSDWVVDETQPMTQPLPSNSSDDLTMQLRLDMLTHKSAPKAPLLKRPPK